MKISIRTAVFLFAFTALPAAADASINVNITQSGVAVLANMSGSIDLTGLSADTQYTLVTGMWPSIAYVATGAAGSLVEGYTGLTGPSSFGSGGTMDATTSLGDPFAMSGIDFGIPYVFLPVGYVSGSPLSGSATWLGQSFASLGVTPGTYTYSTANGAPEVVINIGGVAGAVPEPATWAMMLLGFGAVGWAVRRKQRAAGSLQLA